MTDARINKKAAGARDTMECAGHNIAGTAGPDIVKATLAGRLIFVATTRHYA